MTKGLLIFESEQGLSGKHLTTKTSSVLLVWRIVRRECRSRIALTLLSTRIFGSQDY